MFSLLAAGWNVIAMRLYDRLLNKHPHFPSC
jgi:hypothetical protein